MSVLSDLFKKRDKPKPYNWAFLKERCVQAIDARVVPVELMESQIGDLDYDRLVVTGEDAENVVVEVWAVLSRNDSVE
jgi:hypothetical protein